MELFLWTFTFKEALDVREAALRWRRFLGDRARDGLLQAFPTMAGLRVFELHPGEEGRSHGLHIHMVCNEWLPVDIVRSIADRKGLGRVHVKKIPRGAAFYLGKYLSKDRTEALAGMRLWAPIGKAETCKVRDIVVDSRWTASYRFLNCAIGGFEKLTWNEKVRLVTHFTLGENIGEALDRIGYVRTHEADAA